MELLAKLQGESKITSHITKIFLDKTEDIDNIYIPGFRKSHNPDTNRQRQTVRSTTKRNSLSLSAKMK